MAARRFELILIKPSHYDDDGYVIQWFRSIVPSNSLAALHGLASECAERHILGVEVDIAITAIDETNARVRPGRLIRQIRKAGGGLIALVGVQSNQFPRALDIARPLRQAGVPVAIGGFHVSGCLAMLPGIQPDLQRALEMGISLFAGEAEGRLDEVLQDAARGTLKPIYNHMDELPGIDGAPIPFMPPDRVKQNLRVVASFDAGRGCPFQCSFCTIINVQGRKSRSRSAEDIAAIVRRNVAEGIYRFFITDDNFARNKDWEAIFDTLIRLREQEGLHQIKFTIQVDTQCHRMPNFIDKARRAGVNNIFIGLENINAEALQSSKKRQNKITDYRALLLACKQARIFTVAGYILGFPNDNAESIRRDIEIIKRELPIDVLEFFCLTPLPGSEDHKRLAASGTWMDPDMNKYDLEHVVTAHPQMSKAEWEQIYPAAWDAYYTHDHMVTLMRRGEAFGIGWRRILEGIAFFYHSFKHEGVHPLQGGLFRIKRRRERRPELPRENPFIFYPRYWSRSVANNVALVMLFRKYMKIGMQIERDPNRVSYMDKAITPVREEDDSELELLTHTPAARAAVQHVRKVQRLTGGMTAGA